MRLFFTECRLKLSFSLAKAKRVAPTRIPSNRFLYRDVPSFSGFSIQGVRKLSRPLADFLRVLQIVINRSSCFVMPFPDCKTDF